MPTQTLADYPAVAEIENRLSSLKAELSDVESHLANPFDIGRQAEAEITARAAALAAGKAVSDEPITRSDLEIRALHDREQVLKAAIGLVDREASRIRQEAGREIAEQTKPKYEKLIAEIAATLVKLAGLIEDSERLLDGMRTQGIDNEVVFVGMPLPEMRLADSSAPFSGPPSRAGRWLARAEQHYGIDVQKLQKRMRNGRRS